MDSKDSHGHQEITDGVMDDTQFKFLLQNRRLISIEDLKIKEMEKNFVSIGGWKVNVSRAIYSKATKANLMQGWKLVEKIVPMEILSLVFFIRSADDYLRDRKTRLNYDNGFEPDIVELLRFCYWYLRCSQNQEIRLQYKIREIRHQLGKKLPARLGSYFSQRQDYSLVATKFNNNLLKELSRIENNPEPKDKKTREQFYDKDEFYKLRKDFVEKVAAYVSELMICFLLVEVGFNARFVQKTVNQKKYDILLENIPCDIKTILDEYPWFDQPESQLREELVKSLKRIKIQEKIEEAMKQGARIAFLSATQTSMGKGANQEAAKNLIKHLTIKGASDKAIKFVRSDNISNVPVVVVTTSIDYERKYRITAFYLQYPTVLSPRALKIDDIQIGQIGRLNQ